MSTKLKVVKRCLNVILVVPVNNAQVKDTQRTGQVQSPSSLLQRFSCLPPVSDIIK